LGVLVVVFFSLRDNGDAIVYNKLSLIIPLTTKSPFSC
jgi:hypothetical protein